MKEFEIYSGPGFEISFEVDGREAEMVRKGPFSRVVDYVASGFNEHASLDKVARVDDDRVHITCMVPTVPSGPFQRLVMNQIKRIVFKRRPLESLMLISTRRCQCSCEHCIVHGLKEGSELTTSEMKELIDEAVDLGVYHISFEGGEPTLREDIDELVGYVDPEVATTHLITNGLKLDEDLVDRLDSAGLEYLHISLDSPYPEEHDEFRGVEGTFNKALDGLQLGMERGMLGVVEYTAYPGNSDWQRLEDLYSLCEERGVDEILIDEVVPGGRWENKEENLLSSEDYSRLEEFQEQKNQLEDGPRVSRSYQYREPDIMGCFGGRRWLWVTPTGEILPCFHTALSFGNWREKGLKQAWKEMGKHPLFKKPACTWSDPEYMENYFPSVARASEKGEQPFPIDKIDR
ncbi:radical SAM protein [Methanonatronarchaeum sp. AMET6-2]|uniref:radical SAM protein n=1 Tax=Methanonatronarchaeum sp. AMET6-2 TaxID=2933293 RepID=UPI0011F6C27B|nr:radical SAM protein [Methanonatronarchaeum sp. AMET6-2]RZN61859.1 MAG: radical SAM protein [Methanonatronarchaeia archaeon]UOY10229.1 radical SAM protein [Methanonatronarchaeum sp. AMET6-2]